MIMRLSALITIELLLSLFREAYSFNNRSPSQKTILPLSREHATARWSAVSPFDEQRKQFTKDALHKLLERQKKELAETEYMINRLDRVSSRTGGEITDAELLDHDSDFSLASSILAGVDFGFVSRSEGSTLGLTGGYPIEGSDAKGEPFSQYGPPGNIFMLGAKQFMRNLNAIRGEYDDEADVVLTAKQRELQKSLESLTLNSTAIWEREMAAGPIVAPWLIKIPYLVLCWFLDVVFEDRYVFARFFLLETVARMPYFSYIGMLHFYETLGFWRRSSDIKRIHFAEEWNEYHHLLIMESLGGDQRYWVRALAQHSAILYFFVLCFLWAFSPTLAYKFSELLETHAVNTYSGFLDENEEALKKIPPPISAVNYYALGRGDPLFGEYQTSAMATNGEIRRPGDNMQSLYDVFSAIRADEGDHVGTMKACLDPNVAVQSPSLEKKVLTAAAMVGVISYFLVTSDIIDVTNIGDIVDTASDAGAVADESATGLFEAVAAAAAGFAQQLAKDSEEGNSVALFEDLVESGGIAVALEAIRQGLVKALITLLEFLAALL